MPGLGRINLAVLLAEAWQPLRRRDYHALRCLSGVAPVTRRSGKTCIVVRRYACNKRLENALYHWARVATQHDAPSRVAMPRCAQRGHSHGRALAHRRRPPAVGGLHPARTADPVRPRLQASGGRRRMSLSLSSLCSIENDHPFVPTCRSAEHRAQRQSRMPPAKRRHRQSRRAASLTERARCYPPGAGRSLRDTALPQPGAGISRLLLAIVTSRFPMPVTVASSPPCRPKDRSGIHPVWTFSARPSAGLPPRIFRLIIGGGSAPIEGAGAQFQCVAKPSPLMGEGLGGGGHGNCRRQFPNRRGRVSDVPRSLHLIS